MLKGIRRTARSDRLKVHDGQRAVASKHCQEKSERNLVAEASLDIQSLPEPEIEPEPDDPEPDDPEPEAPWEDEPVTLCIAVACQENNKPRIVLCTDWKSSSPLGASQTADKLRWIKKKPVWLALTAGKARAIESIVRYYRRKLQSQTITDTNAQVIFDHLARNQLLRRKDHCVHRDLGVRYQYFRAHRSEFPDAIQIETFMNVRKTGLDAALLIVGFVTDGSHSSPHPLICKVDVDASTEIHPHFAAVGEGLLVALPSLIRREVDCNISLKKAIYEVYEAKTLAQTVSSVGDDTSIDVFYPDGSIKSVTSKRRGGYAYLDRQLKRYGPKRKVTTLTGFKDTFLEHLPLSGVS